MDLKVYRKALEESLNNDISLKENQTICNMLQITDKTIESSIETEIKEANRVKAVAEAEKVQAEIEKIKAETKTAKVDALTKVGGLFVSVLGTVIGVGGLIFVNGMNIESHRNEEMKYSDSERDCERTIFTKTLDFFTKKK
jgi:hypothetical protein